MARFPETACDEIAAYCAVQIRHICESCSSRSPGSEGERRCQEYLAGELSKVGLEPEMETFPVAQKAFMAVPVICSGLGLVAAFLYWIYPPVAALVAALALVIFGMEVVLYRHVLTPIFPKKQSTNLCAVIKPRKEMRRRLIFGGHADAAYEWRYHHACPNWSNAIARFIIFSVLWVFVASLLNTRILSGPHGHWLDGTVLVASVGTALGVFFTRFSVVAQGAVDNLSGAVLGVAVARAIKQAGAELDHTEVMVLVCGSEEAGLCGAKAFANRHKARWRDVPTAYIALDSFRELPHFNVYNRDMNGRVRHDPVLCDLLKQAGRDCGLELAYATVKVGASDAAAFTQAGIPAALLCAMDPKPAHYYHTRRDVWTLLDQECLRQAARVLVAAIERFDGLAAEVQL